MLLGQNMNDSKDYELSLKNNKAFPDIVKTSWIVKS